MGTAGSDDFAIKVSSDGSAFVTGLSIASATGQVTMPAALRLGGQASDPVSPPDGTIWLNSTTGEVKMRSGGATVVIATGGAPLTDGDKGDITVSATGTVWSIDSGAITNAKLADVPTATFKGRTAAGTGAVSDISPADAVSILPIFTETARGVVPLSGGGTTNFLRADGTWAAPAGGALIDLGVTATASQLNQLAGTALGTAAFVSTGTSAGQIPVLNANNVLPDSAIWQGQDITLSATTSVTVAIPTTATEIRVVGLRVSTSAASGIWTRLRVGGSIVTTGYYGGSMWTTNTAIQNTPSSVAAIHVAEAVGAVFTGPEPFYWRRAFGTNDWMCAGNLMRWSWATGAMSFVNSRLVAAGAVDGIQILISAGTMTGLCRIEWR